MLPQKIQTDKVYSRKGHKVLSLPTLVLLFIQAVPWYILQ